MEKEKYIQDLKDIKDMMSKSSRFISLSGLSGILAGTYALIGAFLVQNIINTRTAADTFARVSLNFETKTTLAIIAFGVLLLSVSTGIFLTTRKARKAGLKVWDDQSKRLLINLLIPLVTGGLLCVILISKGFATIVAPLTLIFYGLALVNASKYTLNDVRSLGIAEVILGLVDIYFDGNGLLIWSIGFGVLHIIYGIIMYMKYDR